MEDKEAERIKIRGEREERENAVDDKNGVQHN